MTPEPVLFDGARLHLEHIRDIARRSRPVQLSRGETFVRRVTRGAEFVDRQLRTEGVIYGVTTGYGDSCQVIVPPQQASELSQHIYRYHGCGFGPSLSPQVVRAVLATRLQSLCQGYSGVRYALLERIETLLQRDLLPVIPEEGSVGASGDLTPLSYLAAVICGEREVWCDGVRRDTAGVYRELDLEPMRLQAKEGLAVMNGTSVMTAQACLALARADQLARLATRATAMTTVCLQGNAYHFDETLFSLKPHAGQQEIARRLREDLGYRGQGGNEGLLQDRYSIRCAPHIIGVLEDAIPWLRSLVENELNSANDNPLVDVEQERVLHGGHFYGGHVAMAMDTLKNAVANLVDMLDRQLALMVDTRFNHGMPANLSGAKGDRAAVNHGLKALQISVSSWTAEALKLTMPASAFSRSTECHNQDKVSMGSLAARDALRVLQLAEQAVAAALIAVRQGLAIRLDQGQVRSADLEPAVRQMYEDLCSMVEFICEDRALESDLKALVNAVQAGRWSLYDAG